MKRFLFVSSIVMGVLLYLLCVWACQMAQPAWQPEGGSPQLILDAGHGGEDGGAISISGVSESRINLDLVQKLDRILGLYGEAPVLLRDQDCSLHSPGAVTLRQKKVSDLKNRVSAIQSTDRAVLISIHQNTYPDAGARGLQSFYAPTNGSEELAVLIQTAIRDTLQQENHRKAKRIPDSVYLMNRVSCRAVLVECGFLTNPEEERLLLDRDYQKKMASVLASVWLTEH